MNAKSTRYHGKVVTCGGCGGTGIPNSKEWEEDRSPCCTKCGGSGKRKVCMNIGCQEFGCEGHGHCEVQRHD